MFICEGQQELLPPWARFVRGVIDCPYLQPTASREEIHQDDTFISVQQAIEQQLTAALKRIAHEEPVTWKKLVTGHSDIIMGWAVRDNEFFAQVADMMPFRTSRGVLTLAEYLQHTDNTIYFVTRELGSLQEKLLGEGHGVPVIDASWFAVAPFLEKYAALHNAVELIQLDGEARQLFHVVDEEPYTLLLNYFHNQSIRVRIVTFKHFWLDQGLRQPVGKRRRRTEGDAIYQCRLSPDPEPC
jgi:molecular chaperone HtpG